MNMAIKHLHSHCSHCHQTTPLPPKHTRQELSPFKNGPAWTHKLFVTGEKRLCCIFSIRVAWPWSSWQTQSTECPVEVRLFPRVWPMPSWGRSQNPGHKSSSSLSSHTICLTLPSLFHLITFLSLITENWIKSSPTHQFSPSWPSQHLPGPRKILPATTCLWHLLASILSSWLKAITGSHAPPTTHPGSTVWHSLSVLLKTLFPSQTNWK